MSGIVIVGASHSGVAAAAALRNAGYAGTLTMLTQETQTPYHRPPLSKEGLVKDDYLPTPLRPESFYSSNNIRLVRGAKVVALQVAESRILFEDGGTLPFQTLVLATGAEPRRLSPAVDPAGIAHYLRTHDDLLRLKARLERAKSLAIVGGGLIGMELAAAALAKGLRVSLIEAGARIMQRTFSKSVAEYVLDRNLNKGLQVRMRSSVSSVSCDSQDIAIITLSDVEQLKADIVVAAIGAAPHDGLAREAGLAVDDGILVSEEGRTSHPSIYAIGDCSAWYNPVLQRHVRNEAVNPGQDQAKIVAAAIVGAELPPKRMPRYWSHQGAMQIQMCGDVNGADAEAVLNAPASGAFSVLGFRDNCLVAVQSINAPQQFGRLHDMIGMGREVVASVLEVEFPPPHHH